jgi:adenine-specific DNA-methyltransferase
MTKLVKEALLKPEQLAKLKELFPQTVVDGKIDFVLLKTLLGEQVEVTNEKYQFTWNGKQNAIAHSQKPSSGTLREDKPSSKDFDSTENLYIEGDNLEVLKLLQKTYQSKIKMIYIDPPYNTGNEFVYKDDFKDSVKNYLELTNQKNKSNAETSGRYHTDWLNMMYPRLMLARNLLTDDGVIFISIDDNEQSNLKKICDEIFGEMNFVDILIFLHLSFFHDQILNY